MRRRPPQARQGGGRRHRQSGGRRVALFRIQVKIHSRGKGGGNMLAASAYRAATALHEPGLGPVASAVHASAHIAGERLEEEHGRTWDYTRKAGVLHSE